MQNDILDTMNKLTQQTIENWKKMGETNLKISEKLLQQQVELTSALIEAATCNAGEVSKTKDVKEIAAMQTEFAQDCGKKVMESYKSCADILSEAGKAYNTMFEAGVKSASDNFASVKPAKSSKAA